MTAPTAVFRLHNFGIFLLRIILVFTTKSSGAREEKVKIFFFSSFSGGLSVKPDAQVPPFMAKAFPR
jgi:hypothetical protein